MSRVLSLAGFQVTLIGRFWVTPEAPLATKPTGLRSTLRDSIPTLLQRIRCLSVKAVSEGQNRAHESYKCFWVGLVGGFCHFRVEVNQLYLLNFCRSEEHTSELQSR